MRNLGRHLLIAIRVFFFDWYNNKEILKVCHFSIFMKSLDSVSLIDANWYVPVYMFIICCYLYMCKELQKNVASLCKSCDQ